VSEVKDYFNENIFSCSIKNLGDRIYEVLDEFAVMRLPEIDKELTQ